jgi:hypothetical protein
MFRTLSVITVEFNKMTIINRLWLATANRTQYCLLFTGIGRNVAT